MRPLRPGDNPAPNQPLTCEVGKQFAGVECIDFGIGERKFQCRAQQLRAEHVGVVRVGDGGLDRLVQQGLRVVHEEGIEWIVSGHEQDQGALGAASRAAGLLPERGDGAGEPGDHHGIEPCDVDAELERIRGGRAE